MPKKLEPRQWERFYELINRGFSRSDASRLSGVSLNSVRRFEAGDPGSSGHEWTWWREHFRNVGAEPGPISCSACGQRLPDA